MKNQKMTKPELGESIKRFGEKLKELPELRKQIEPAIPEELKIAQKQCITHRKEPSDFSLSLLYQFSLNWNETQETYLRNMGECEKRLDALRLSINDKEVLRGGYKALKFHVKDIGKDVDRYGKVYLASAFSEGKLEEFCDYMSSHTSDVYEEIHEAEEEKGGVIFYTNDGFRIDFRLNEGKLEFEGMVKKLRTRKKKRRKIVEQLYNMAKYKIELELEKAHQMGVEELFIPVLRDLEKLRHGQLTEELKSCLRRKYTESHSHDLGPILNDNRLFSEDSGTRLFSFFHHHRKLEEPYLIGDYRKPSIQDINTTWEMGPHVLFIPDEGKLTVYFISRGNSTLVGNYSV